MVILEKNDGQFLLFYGHDSLDLSHNLIDDHTRHFLHHRKIFFQIPQLENRIFILLIFKFLTNVKMKNYSKCHFE